MSYLGHSLGEGVLPLCRDIVGLFKSQLGHCYLYNYCCCCYWWIQKMSLKISKNWKFKNGRIKWKKKEKEKKKSKWIINRNWKFYVLIYWLPYFSFNNWRFDEIAFVKPWWLSSWHSGRFVSFTTVLCPRVRSPGWDTNNTTRSRNDKKKEKKKKRKRKRRKEEEKEEKKKKKKKKKRKRKRRKEETI